MSFSCLFFLFIYLFIYYYLHIKRKKKAIQNEYQEISDILFQYSVTRHQRIICQTH